MDLRKNPEAGETVEGTGGFHKYRFAPPSWNTGKSGSTRVLHLPLFAGRLIVLGVVYGKNEVATISKDGKKALRNVAEMYAAELKRHFPKPK